MRDRPTRVDVAVALGLLALTATDLLLSDRSPPVLGGAVALLIAGLTGVRRTAPLVSALSAAAAIAVVFAVGRQDDLPDIVLLSLGLVSYSLGDLVDTWPSRAGLAVAILGTYGAQIALDGGNSSPPLLYAVTGPWLAGTVVRARRRLATQLESTVSELAAERSAYVALAVEHERRVIARELHDIVGHAMSLITIQAAAGRHLARTQPARAAEALDVIVDAGRQAHVEVGRLRGILDRDPGEPPGLDRAPALLAHAAAAGMRVRVAGRPSDVELSPAVDHTAFRVLQEALTNVMKHAGACDVDVTLCVQDDELWLDVHNRRADHPAPMSDDHGRGLQGMAERVEAVGGHFYAGPDRDGWRVRARLPIAHRLPDSQSQV